MDKKTIKKQIKIHTDTKIKQLIYKINKLTSENKCLRMAVNHSEKNNESLKQDNIVLKKQVNNLKLQLRDIRSMS